MHRRSSSHILVVLQLLFVGLSCYPVGWRNTGSAWFLLLCLFGGILGIVVLYYNRIGNFSVYPELREGAKLITDGPYRLVRHPMYSALMLMMAGISGYNGHPYNVIGLVGLILVVSRKAILEERYLTAAFPEYPLYAARLKRFVPGVI